MNLPGWIEQRVLGHGSYGRVYKAQRGSDGKSYAVKIINLAKLTKREIEDSVNEVRLMASINSPFVIGFYESFASHGRLVIVSEYAQLGDLNSLIERRRRKNRPFPESLVWRFLLQIMSGLSVLHTLDICHRDIKSANILLCAPDHVKLADLGISTALHHHHLARTQIGTPLYISPEIWRRCSYSTKCDIWSLGVLIFEMVTFQFPFYGRTSEELSRRICAGHFTIPATVSAEMQTVIRRCLVVNPAERASLSQLFQLPCIRARKQLLDPFETVGEGRLLATIHVPDRHLERVILPAPSYGQLRVQVKPMQQRLHVKNDPRLRLPPIQSLTTPELRLVAEQDLWSPNPSPRSLQPADLTDHRSRHSDAVRQGRVAQIVFDPPPPGRGGRYIEERVREVREVGDHGFPLFGRKYEAGPAQVVREVPARKVEPQSRHYDPHPPGLPVLQPKAELQPPAPHPGWRQPPPLPVHFVPKWRHALPVVPPWMRAPDIPLRPWAPRREFRKEFRL